MRKLTYKQAATLNENLKARVTPEQSEKMQRAWFAAGKTWGGGDNTVSCLSAKWLVLDESLSYCYDYQGFVLNICEEIELIDDLLLLQPDFASQQEVTLWVATGNQVKHKQTNHVFGFKNGEIYDFTKEFENACQSFVWYKDWQKHTPPRLIRVNGIEVPAPLDEIGNLKDIYIPIAHHPKKYKQISVNSANEDYIFDLIADGLGCATKEDAIKRAEAMLKFEVVE